MAVGAAAAVAPANVTGAYSGDSLRCFREAARHGAAARASTAASAAAACSACRGQFLLAPVLLYESSGPFWASLCAPRACVDWQARELVRSLLPERGAAASLVGPPTRARCAELPALLSGSRPDVDAPARAAEAWVRNGPRRRVAVCLHSRDERLDPVALHALRSHVIQPAGAEVFAFVDATEERRPWAEGLLRRLLRPVRLAIEAPLESEEVVAQAKGNMSAEEWALLERATRGMVFLLHNMYKVDRCWRLIQAEEALRRTRFDLVVAMRADLLWLAPLPLHLFHGDGLWIPDGQDWGGFNDRWAVVGRRWAELYFGRWSAVRRGFLREEPPRVPPESTEWQKVDTLGPTLGSEVFLGRAIDAAGACPKVRRVLSPAALRCCPGSSALRQAGGCTLDGTARACTEHGFRQAQEAEDAHNVARLLEQGWRWTSDQPWRLQFLPDVFAMHVEGPEEAAKFRRFCCELPQSADRSRASCAGYASCFPAQIATYHRVCHGGLLAVGLEPPPASRPGAEGAGGCWGDKDYWGRLCLLPPPAA